MKALIIDDEPSAVQTLRLMIERYTPQIKQVRTTTDPLEGIELIRSFQPDLLFLDVQMPVMNGFDLLKHISKTIPVIFTTAHDQYAIQAIRFSALDYLLKPIDADELANAVGKYITRSQNSTSALFENFLHNINARNTGDFKLALSTTEGVFFFMPEEIIRLEAVSNYTQFYFIRNKKMMTSKTLKEYDELLSPYGFLRVHKSHLVNKRHVLHYTADGILTMRDQSKVEVSRRRKEEVIHSLKS